MKDTSTVEYRIEEEETHWDLLDRLNKLAKEGWKARGYGIRSTSMRDHYSALLERTIK